METNNKPLKQSPQQSQAVGEVYFHELQVAASNPSQQRIGSMKLQKSLQHATALTANDITPVDAWYGCNIQRAMREDGENTVDVLTLLFAQTLEMMNLTHPWNTKELARKQVKEMIAFDQTNTVEDLALMMDMMKRGQLANHYNRPNVAWVESSMRKYAELKAAAREQLADREKKDRELERMMAMDPQMDKRTMAQFLGGRNRLTPMDREEMKANDRERKAK
jgi:hypothetical protein